MTRLAKYLKPTATHVLLGSSGAGKSTLINALAGHELMATAAIRAHDGQADTPPTHRELILLTGGALLLDHDPDYANLA
jgi:ribosome biogenesis GTPase